MCTHRQAHSLLPGPRQSATPASLPAFIVGVGNLAQRKPQRAVEQARRRHPLGSASSLQPSSLQTRGFFASRPHGPKGAAHTAAVRPLAHRVAAGGCGLQLAGAWGRSGSQCGAEMQSRRQSLEEPQTPGGKDATRLEGAWNHGRGWFVVSGPGPRRSFPVASPQRSALPRPSSPTLESRRQTDHRPRGRCHQRPSNYR